MYEDHSATLGGEVIDKPKVEKPKVKKPTRAERIAAWKYEHKTAIAEARQACCTCTPTRAQMLLADQADGRAPAPVD